MLFSQDAWIFDAEDREARDVIDELLRNPLLARFYSAMAALDTETSTSLRQSPGLRKLVRSAPVLDFYGAHIHIRSGRVIVPGGESAETAWKELVGANPEAPGEFITRLLSKDEGWLAAYFDALSSVSQARQAYFADAQRLKHFYEALRGHNLSPDPSAPIFRPVPGLPLLVTRLNVEPNGQPHVPGDLESWKAIFRRYADSKTAKDWANHARHWKDPEQLVEGLFALSREPVNTESLQLYSLLSEMDRGRSPEQRLTPQTVRLLAEKFVRFGDQSWDEMFYTAIRYRWLDETSAKLVDYDNLIDQTRLFGHTQGRLLLVPNPVPKIDTQLYPEMLLPGMKLAPLTTAVIVGLSPPPPPPDPELSVKVEV